MSAFRLTCRRCGRSWTVDDITPTTVRHECVTGVQRLVRALAWAALFVVVILCPVWAPIVLGAGA